MPKQVIRFLNDAENRSNIRGVIAAGNSNFGATFGIAGDIISAKCQVPYLYRFELLGTDDGCRQRRDTDWNDFGHAQRSIAPVKASEAALDYHAPQRHAEPL